MGGGVGHHPIFIFYIPWKNILVWSDIGGRGGAGTTFVLATQNIGGGEEAPSAPPVPTPIVVYEAAMSS